MAIPDQIHNWPKRHLEIRSALPISFRRDGAHRPHQRFSLFLIFFVFVFFVFYFASSWLFNSNALAVLQFYHTFCAFKSSSRNLQKKKMYIYIFMMSYRLMLLRWGPWRRLWRRRRLPSSGHDLYSGPSVLLFLLARFARASINTTLIMHCASRKRGNLIQHER